MLVTSIFSFFFYCFVRQYTLFKIHLICHEHTLSVLTSKSTGFSPGKEFSEIYLIFTLRNPPLVILPLHNCHRRRRIDYIGVRHSHPSIPWQQGNSSARFVCPIHPFIHVSILNCHEKAVLES